jgi:hypothetical protein
MISDAQNQEVRFHPLREYLPDFTIQTCNQVQNFHSGRLLLNTIHIFIPFSDERVKF